MCNKQWIKLKFHTELHAGQIKYAPNLKFVSIKTFKFEFDN